MSSGWARLGVNHISKNKVDFPCTASALSSESLHHIWPVTPLGALMTAFELSENKGARKVDLTEVHADCRLRPV